MPIRHPSQETALRTSPLRERAARVLSVVALLAGVTYIVWRLLETLNPDALWLSIPLWVAEAWTIMTAGLLFFSAWDPFLRPPPPPAPKGRTVDVFVPTLNEPEWVVRRTLIGALAIDYPHKTWLLDDGNRPEMRALAEELGVGYLPRESSEGAKAGHLNYALERTDGEFIALFDADHIATPEFLDRTLGYLVDDEVAFVQTPQEFYNVDSFEHSINRRTKVAWHGQTIFYRLLQPGKDRWNAAFFCGSNAVLRRSAIEDVGGFPTETVTEDIHLSILLHAKGWRSVFQREVLAYGLAPQTAVGYQTQRLRWGQGGMQVLRKANPLTIRGLSLPQRICYMASLLPWFDGWQKIVFYTVPPLFLLTGALPLRADAALFAGAFVATYGLLLLTAKVVSRGTSNLLLSDAYSAATFPVFIKATLGLVVRRRLKFAVTDKEGVRRVPLASVRWQVAFLMLTSVAIGVGAYRLASGDEPNQLAFFVTLGWAALNMGMLAWAVHHVLTTVERRGKHRVPAFLPVRWEADGHEGMGVLENLNESGGRLRMRGQVVARTMELRVWPSTYQSVTGVVQRSSSRRGETVVGLQWDASSGGRPADLTAMAVLFAQRRFLHHTDVVNRNADAGGWRPSDLAGLIPVRQLDASEDSWGMLEDQGGDEAVAVLGSAVEAGARLRLAPWDEQRVWRGTVTAVRRVQLSPFPVFEVHLANVARDGSRMPGRDDVEAMPGGWPPHLASPSRPASRS